MSYLSPKIGNVSSSGTPSTGDFALWTNTNQVGAGTPHFNSSDSSVSGINSFSITGNTRLDIINNCLVNPVTNHGTVDWSNFSQYDYYGYVSIDWNNRALEDSSEAVSLNWYMRQQYDFGGAIAIDWASRDLIDLGGGTVSLDWGNRALIGIYGETVADWGGGYTFHVGSGIGLEVDNLNPSTQTCVVNGALQFTGGHGLIDDGNSLSVDPDNHQLVYNGTNSVDWQICQLIGLAGQTSIDWEARQLWASDGITLALDWSDGYVNTYKGISTVRAGMPAEYGQANLTGQAGAVGAQTVYAVPASGLTVYRVTYVATITRAASSSSTLGGANGFQIIYTDGNDSVVKTSQVGPTSTANTTGTSISGSLIAYCKASTNLQFSFGYISSGVTTMQYNLHVTVEAL